MRKFLLSSAALLLLVACQSDGQSNQAQAPVSPTANTSANVNTPADRQVLFGDLHLHTANSFDAYVLMGTRTTPEDAYRFARGDTINYLGQDIKRAEPLDFLAVTDHSENIGVWNELQDPNSAVSRSELGQQVRHAIDSGELNIFAKRDGVASVLALLQRLLAPNALHDVDTASISQATWQRELARTNRFNEPGKFTTFIAYEWTSMPSGQNLHRNVIFSGDRAPNPFTSLDSEKPEDLWAFLTRTRQNGIDAISIPHNANASNGLMYDWTTLSGRPIDAEYATARSLNEPLSEISQNKGTSETHPSLSTTDEFANFEIFDRLLIGALPSKPEGSYLRQALARGLALQASLGVNPYKDGFVGAGDLHGGLSVSSERDFGGNIGAINQGGGSTNRELAAYAVATPTNGQLFSPVITSSGGLTAVWAEQNTRPSIFSAFRRKEVYATSGTRIRVRFFAGWDYPQNLAEQGNWVEQAYRGGVPMGGDIVQNGQTRAPHFLVWASKDPNGANLDRVQVVKVWSENGALKEKIYDVAYEDGRQMLANGHLAPVGNSVDLATGNYQNNIGSSHLAKVWTDPDFNPAIAASYYVRVLEIPTPRWSTLLAQKYGLTLPTNVPATIQERAWSSPIWYTPRRS